MFNRRAAGLCQAVPPCLRRVATAPLGFHRPTWLTRWLVAPDHGGIRDSAPKNYAARPVDRTAQLTEACFAVPPVAPLRSPEGPLYIAVGSAPYHRSVRLLDPWTASLSWPKPASLYRPVAPLHCPEGPLHLAVGFRSRPPKCSFARPVDRIAQLAEACIALLPGGSASQSRKTALHRLGFAPDHRSARSLDPWTAPLS